MIYQLNLTNTADIYEFQVDIDNNTYIFAIRYNTRNGLWYCDLKNDTGEHIISGVPLLLGVNLFSRFAYSEAPQRDFFIVNYNNQYIEMDYNNVGVDSFLQYEVA